MDGELIRVFTINFTNGSVITISRQKDEISDTLQIILNSLPDTQIIDAGKFVSAIQECFKASYSEKVINTALNKQFSDFYQKREADLAKLESTTINLISKTEEFIRKKEEDFLNKEEILKNKFNDLENKQIEEYKTKESKLNEERETLESKKKEFDDRESKHVRRKIREDLKTEFKNRSQKFQLTEGTRKLRNPISYFSILLLIIFGAGFLTLTILSIIELATTNNFDMNKFISLTAKQIVFALAFGSTSIFFIRWSNKWFEKHSDEEFKLKRYEIDLDRASWLAEMAFEWKSEKGTEIPPELLEHLSKNLFTYEEKDQTPLHPSEQLANAILGVASSASLKIPGGTELHLDRKGLKKLEK
jgi:hypothetical protein